MDDNPPAGLSEHRKAALAYVAEGMFVFRVAANEKRPAEPHGHHDATNDPAEVRRRWTETPDANVGIALAPSGLVVVDIDGDPATLYGPVLERSGALPATRMHLTGGGGAHLIYRVAEGADDLGRKIRPWGPELPVDVLADGYVIAPPSIVSGHAYSVHTAASIAPAPDAVVTLVRRQPRPPEVTAPPLADGEDLIPSGTRDNKMFAIFAGFAEQGLRGDALIEAALEVNRRRCDPPCPEADVIAKARNAQRNVERYGKLNRPEKIHTGGLKKPKTRSEDAQPMTGVRVVSTVPASSVKVETTQFVDPHSTVPVGALTVLAGDPGLGKTTWAMRLAARVSKGTAHV